MDDGILAFRRQLAAAIVRSLGPGSQHAVSRSFGIPQPRMSELNRGIVDRCSLEWLILRVQRLGGTVSLTVEVGDAGRAWTRDRTSRMPGKAQSKPVATGGPANGRAREEAAEEPAEEPAEESAEESAAGALIPNLE